MLPGVGGDRPLAWSTLCREVGNRHTGAGSAPCKGSWGLFVWSLSAASAVGIATYRRGHRPGRHGPWGPKGGQEPSLPRASTSCVGGTSALPAAVPEGPAPCRGQWSFLPPPPAPTTSASPKPRRARGPTAVPTRLPLLPPVAAGEAVLPEGGGWRWASREAPHCRVSVLGRSLGRAQSCRAWGNGRLLRACPCWVLTHCGGLPYPLVPSPLPDTPFLPPSCPSLKPGPFQPHGNPPLLLYLDSCPSLRWGPCAHEPCVLLCPAGRVACPWLHLWSAQILPWSVLQIQRGPGEP